MKYDWQASLGKHQRCGATKKADGTRRFRPTLEPLEDRTLPSAFPFVQSIVRTTPAGPNTNATSVSYTATFSEPVTGVNGTDFALALGGSAAATGIAVTPVNASVSVYTVTVSGITGSGSLQLNLVDNGSIHDLAGNPLTQQNAPAAFQAQQTFATGPGPRAVALADVNGDGKPDILVLNSGNNTVGVLLGNGDGTFQAQQTFATGIYPNNVTLGDVNGDGILDLLVPNRNSDTVSVLLGNGNGSFRAQQTFATGSYPVYVAVSDVNGDGKPDLVIPNRNPSNTVSLLLGNGNGTFQAQQTLDAGLDPTRVAVGDLNGDGRPDLAVTNLGTASSNGALSVLLGNGNGTFQARQTFATGPLPASVELGDVNGDGKLDAAVGNQFPGTVSVLLGNGNGTFQTQQTYAAGSGAGINGPMVDVNGDGKLDLVVNNFLSNTVSVLLGNGNGTFQAIQTFAAGSIAAWVALGDVNGDGKPDLVVANQGSNTVSVLLGNGTGNFPGQAYTIFQTFPFVVSINRNSPPGPSTTATSVSYTVTFSEAVTGVNLSDFQLALSGTVSATLSQITPVSSSVYTVTVSAITGTGSLGLNLVDNGSIRDVAGNPLTQQNAPATFQLQAQQTFATGFAPRAVALGDVNGDGKLDLAAVNSGSNTVSVLLGNGNGTFQAQQTFATGSNPDTVTLADVNGDGILDLLVPNRNSNTVSVLLGNGNATFQAQQTFATGSYPRYVAVSDVNGDGKPDLVVPNRSSNTVSVLLGNGNGTFQAQITFATGSEPTWVAVGDLNGDGRPDLTITNLSNPSSNGSLSVLLGNGNGTFQAQQTFATGPLPDSVALGDVNGDGKLDAAVANQFPGSTVSVLLGNGNGTFQTQQTLATGSDPVVNPMADVNGDGKPDLIVCNYLSNTVSVLLGNGNGTFQAQQTFAAGSNPDLLASGDVNGDGRPDLVVANQGSNTVSVLLGTGNGNFTGQVYTISAAGATHFAITGLPTTILAGASVSFTVTARDLSNNIATGYTGTVHITTTDSGKGAAVPADYTFTAADQGVHVFTNAVTLVTSGNQTLTTTDTISNTITGSAAINVVPASANHFAIAAPATTTAGSAFSITLSVLDQYNNVVTNYSGTVHFATGDTGVGSFVPSDYAFTTSDQGMHVFTNGAMFVTTGKQTITVTQVNLIDYAWSGHGNLTGQFGTVNLRTGVFTPIGTLPAGVVGGSMARLPGGVLYAETLSGSFVSINPSTAAITTIGNTGLGAIVLAYSPGGTLYVCSYAQLYTINTSTGAATLVGQFGSFSAPISYDAAFDTSGNMYLIEHTSGSTSSFYTVNTSTGAATFVGTTGYSVTDLEFENGTLYGFTLNSQIISINISTAAGTLVANEIGEADWISAAATTSFTGSVVVNVTSAGPTHFAVTAPATAIAGAAFTITVTAKDSFGNTAIGYTGTVHFAKSDTGMGSLVPADYVFVAADQGVHVFTNGAQLVTAGAQTITATDSASVSITGNVVVTVNSSTTTHFIITAPTSATSGTAFTFTVTALDQFGNSALRYTGTVHFTKSDTASGSTVPKDYTFTAADQGAHVFTNGVTLVTAGNQSITATDNVTTSIEGTVSVTVLVPINTLFNTGVSASGIPLPDGTIGDPHYTLVSVPSGSTTTIRVLTSAGGYPIPPWLGDDSLSTWIGPNNDSQDDGPSGNYDYRTTFNLTGLNPASAQISGNWTTDDGGVDMLINGVSTGNTEGGYASFAEFHSFSITSGFQAGLNTLDFIVYNYMVVTGLRVEMTGSANPAPTATHFVITGTPASTVAGSNSTFTLTARDQSNNIATGYTGTVHFTTTDNGKGAAVPADYTFTPVDQGIHVFTNGVTLVTVGSQTLTATDTVSTSISGSATISVTAPAATHFALSAPSTTTAGSAFTVTVTALDQFNNPVNGYTGTVHFANSDAGIGAAAPADYTFTAGDRGVHVFTNGFTLITAGNQTLSATDVTSSSITGSAIVGVIRANATQFRVSAVSKALAGAAFTIMVTAIDQFNNVALGYTGTARFTSTDTAPGSSVPTIYTFTAADQGVHVFTNGVTLVSAGNQTITAADVASSSITGSAIVAVTAANASHFQLTAVAKATADVAFTITVTATDRFNNVVTGFTGTAHFTSTDSGIGGLVPSDYTFLPADQGVHVFSNGTTLVTAGNQTITATDTVSSGITGASPPIAISPAATALFNLIAPASGSVGTPFTFKLTAEDRFGNLTPNYAGTVQFTSSAQAALPANATLNSGVGNFSATPGAIGNVTLTATDSTNSTITGSTVIGVDTGITLSIPTNLTAVPGGTVQVPVLVSALSDPFNHYTGLAAAGLVVFYDPNKFSIQNVGLGVILGNGWIVQATTSTPGVVTVFLSCLSSAPVTGTSGGSLAVLDFQVKSSAPPGPSRIDLAKDNGGAQPVTYVTDDMGFFNYNLTPPPQDNTAQSPSYGYSGFDSDDGTVTILGAANLAVSAPAKGQANVPMQFTVTAVDQSGNTLSSYNGTVHFTSTDANAVLPANATLTAGVGVFSATLKSPGNQTLTATDSVSPGIYGTSGNISIGGLGITSVTPTSTGFVAQFNQTFDPATLQLYSGVADVTLSGPAPSQNVVRGSLIVNSSNTFFTFVKTGTGVAGVLAPGTYTVTLLGGAAGVKDLNGGFLATGNSLVAGANFVTTFAVATNASLILSIPDFARGPNGVANIKLPNSTGTGIPITITNPGPGPVDITSALFSLSYNPALLTISGTLGVAGSSFTLTSNAGGTAQFSFASGTPIVLNAGGTLVLGQVTAQVPNSTAGNYKGKTLLDLSNIVASNGATPLNVVDNDGIEVVAYFGDVSGDGTFSSLDGSLISRVAVGLDEGFKAYPLVDPAIVGGLDGAVAIDSTDITLMNRLLAGFYIGQIPQIPLGLPITATGPDPAISLPSSLEATPGGTVIVPVNIDTARPVGSTGMMEAVLALQFDPAEFAVSPADVGQGTVPLSGSGWQLQAAINSQTGEIGIDLFSTTPSQLTAGGTLVTIAFHVRDNAAAGSTEINLVPAVNPTGFRSFVTTVSDAQGAMVLHTVDTALGTMPGAPGEVTVAGEQRTVGSEQWAVSGEQWPVGSERWAVSGEQCPVGSEQWAVKGKDDAAAVISTVHYSVPALLIMEPLMLLQENALGQPGAILNFPIENQADAGVSEQVFRQQPGVVGGEWVPSELAANLAQTGMAGRRSPLDHFLDDGIGANPAAG